MQPNKAFGYIQQVLKNMPTDWLHLTTHRLDIYNEEFAKTEFLEQFNALYQAENADRNALSELPTAYDYIRLGHPLSTILEWGIGQQYSLPAHNVISFQSSTMPILAVLRKNLFLNKATRILFTGQLPANFDAEAIHKVYGYSFELQKISSTDNLPAFEGSTILLSQEATFGQIKLQPEVDFYIQLVPKLGSIIVVNGPSNQPYISEIQHVRRRESVAMTPANCLVALQQVAGVKVQPEQIKNRASIKTELQRTIKEITATSTTPLIASSGLSIQYAIMMGLVQEALDNHPDKEIKFIVPPNCYGGTNDQARRVAACLPNVEVVDLPVDRENDMVQSVEQVLSKVAELNAIPYIIAEIPTNPRVEVPNLEKLREALRKERITPAGNAAIDPVFILDQTFCPNVQFMAENGVFAGIRAISYVSGSKFPSGGKVTAGYCVANNEAANLMPKIEKHLIVCDNAATDQQLEILHQQMPSMNQRIADAYRNTRELVNFIQEELPAAKINFVSEELADQGFTPSVFSLDLPTKGNSPEEKEAYKRRMNLKLINMMIGQIPDESKYCVSYGQLKGCYWTIPATSTQGTTKEGDKDYIARVSLSPKLDLEKHKEVFKEFVKQM
jgi:cystathionine beta-lyase/cystathionine gamma-synthase